MVLRRNEQTRFEEASLLREVLSGLKNGKIYNFIYYRKLSLNPFSCRRAEDGSSIVVL
jgi:hypothetical protein